MVNLYTGPVRVKGRLTVFAVGFSFFSPDRHHEPLRRLQRRGEIFSRWRDLQRWCCLFDVLGCQHDELTDIESVHSGDILNHSLVFRLDADLQ